MRTPAFCPHCGTDIRLDEPIFLNGYSMIGAGHPLMYNGQRVPLSPTQALICWTLMKAFPAMVHDDVIISRIGSECISNTIEVHVHKIRSHLRQLGFPNPIETVWGTGYLWSLVPVPIQKGSTKAKKAA